jgi:hypothetical protein
LAVAFLVDPMATRIPVGGRDAHPAIEVLLATVPGIQRPSFERRKHQL